MIEPVLRQEDASGPGFARAVLALALLAVPFWACSSQQGARRLADGSYRVECDQSLLSCLAPAAKLCELHGYDVEAASEERSRYGPNPWQAELVKSSATVRCREPDSLFHLFGGVGSKPGAAPSASVSAKPPAAAPVSTPPVPGCVPGTSQACASATGCSGAQVCGADGRSFGACECAPAAASAAPAPAASSSAPAAPAAPAVPAAAKP
jgi:hypothetical protein